MSDDFYDPMAPYYHLIYGDWDDTIARQAAALDRIIRDRWGDEVTSILDATCGIGTQALGLAAKGYRVAASDLSQGALARARQEAEARGLDIAFAAADMRRVDEVHEGPFDLALSADNSVVHLLNDEDVGSALGAFYRAVRPGGGCLVSMRDYDKVEKGGTQLHPFGVRIHEGIRWSVYQVWDWRAEGDIYDFTMYFTADDGDRELKTQAMRSTFYAMSPSRMMALFEEAGFRDVTRVDDVFFQPIIVGTK